MNRTIEQGPIRPPSEAGSLLIRVTRNCPWNKCAFCHTYKSRTFKRRETSEIKAEIVAVKEIVGRLSEAAAATKGIPQRPRDLIAVVEQHGYNRETVLSVLNWLAQGGRTVFLQDADSLSIKTSEILEILDCIRNSLPRVNRITTYCRSRTARRKPQTELDQIAAHGLTRIHIGMESGYDPLLKLIDKGSTQADHIEGGQKIRSAGISLCEYVMPGLGGRQWTQEHSRATAFAINEINPDYLRLRSLALVPGTRLFAMAQTGEFMTLTDEETVAEIRQLLDALTGIETTVVSDHILNLLEEIEGKLPEDKEKMLAVIARFFALSPEDRLIFRLGRRLGYFRHLDDLAGSNHRDALKALLATYQKENPGGLEQDMAGIIQGYI